MFVGRGRKKYCEKSIVKAQAHLFTRFGVRGSYSLARLRQGGGVGVARGVGVIP